MRPLKLPNSEGMVPVSPVLLSRSSVTRPPDIVMPVHPVMARDADQLSRPDPASVDLRPSSVSQSATRPLLLVGFGTAVPLLHVSVWADTEGSRTGVTTPASAKTNAAAASFERCRRVETAPRGLEVCMAAPTSRVVKTPTT